MKVIILAGGLGTRLQEETSVKQKPMVEIGGQAILWHIMIHYPVPPHLSKAYSKLGFRKGAFPITETIASSALSLPMGPHLSIEEAEYVVSMIREYFFLNQ